MKPVGVERRSLLMPLRTYRTVGDADETVVNAVEDLRNHFDSERAVVHAV